MPAFTVPVFLTFHAETRETASESAVGILSWMNDTIQPDPEEDGRFLAADAFPMTDAIEDTNQEYGYRARLCLDAYRAPEDDDEDRLCDLLASLMHYAGQTDLSFTDCLERAQNHYLAEVAGR